MPANVSRGKFKMSLEILEKLYAMHDKRVVDEFVNLVKTKNQKRSPKYPTEYYLYHISLVLTDLRKWSSLKEISTVNNTSKFHYKTIQDKHFEWSRQNLYEELHKILNLKYHPLPLDNYVTLFIDTTNIYNKFGQENIGYGQNPKKQESRISAICDENKNIYSISLVKSVQKSSSKRTFPNDTRTVEPSINKLIEHQPNYGGIHLVGDKGYQTKLEDKIKLFNDYNVKIIYPHKKNQKEKTPEEHKVLLTKRYKIENFFADIKIYDRICTRKDKLSCTYMGFVYLAVLIKYKF